MAAPRLLRLPLLLLAVPLAFATWPAAAQDVPTPPVCAPMDFQAERLGVVVHITYDLTPGATGYTIYRAREDGNLTPAIMMGPLENETFDTQVESRFNYTYMATATIGGVETPSCGTVTVPPGGPCAPEVFARAEGDVIHVGWFALPVTDEYRLYRADGNGSFQLIATIDASTQAYTDADVEAGAVYTYAVTSVVDGEERPPCNVVTVTAIPFFPVAAGGVAALAIAGLGYVALRRRKA